MLQLRIGLAARGGMISVTALVLTLTVFVSSGVLAQTDARTERRHYIEEIVVTAERRAESVQDLTLSVTAFTAETREATGIITAQQQLDFTPGVTYEGSNGRVTIRGVGQASLGPFGLDPGVAVYQDGFYVGSPEYMGGSTFAVERTEVLRGPQGTLYGRNSIGGAVNSITRRPGEVFEVNTRLGMTDYESLMFEGRVSGPITDALRASLRVEVDDQDEGFYRNLSGGGDEGGNGHGWAADFQVAFELGQSIDVWARYLTQERRSHPRSSTAISNPDPANSTAGLAGINNQGIPNVFFDIGSQYGNWGPRDFDTNRRATTELSDFHLFTTELVWAASDAFDIRYVFGSLNYELFQETDRDATSNTEFMYPRDLSFGAFPASFDTVPGTVPVNPSDLADPNVEASFIPWRNDMYGQTTTDFSSWSHEINLVSTGDGPLRWLFGLYYYREDNDFDHRSTYIDNPFYDGIVPDSDFVKSIGYLETRSSAAFGQMDFAFAPDWSATLGLRYSYDEKRGREGLIYTGFIPGGFVVDPGFFVPFDIYFATCGAIACGPGSDLVVGTADDTLSTRTIKSHWSAVTGTAAVQWQPYDATNIYLRYSRGYKSGGFNLGNNAADPMVDEETINAYEIGWKQGVGERLQVNGALFFSRYDDMQLSNAEILNNLQVTSLVNVDEVEIYGAELEATWTPVDALTLRAMYSYLHSEIADGCCFVDSSDPGAMQPGAQPVTDPIDVAGQMTRGQTLVDNQVPGVPENKFGLNAIYTWTFPRGSLSLSGTYTWRDKYYAQLFNTPNWEVKKGEVLDLRSVWRSASERYMLIASVNNVFDEEVPISFFTGTPQQSNFQTVTLQPPRIYGLELQVHF